MAEVELGFVEKVSDPDLLTSLFFPSKVGGKPAWLDIRDLPAPDSLACGVCGKPPVLLLQLYAPIPERPCAFHRSLFVFMCKDPSCHQHQGSKAFRILRCQLPRVNDFYQQDTDNDDVDSGAEGTSTLNCQDADSQRTKSNQTMCKEESETGKDSGISGTCPTSDITTDEDSSTPNHSPDELGIPEEAARSSNAALDTSSCSKKKVTTTGINQTTDLNNEKDRSIPSESVEEVEVKDKATKSSNGVLDTSSCSEKKVATNHAEEEVHAKRDPSSATAATVVQFEMPSLCVVCGCLGPKKCGRCRQPHYCSREHQTHDWKNGHKLFCSDMASGKCTFSDSLQRYNSGFGIQLPELEVITETEPEISEQVMGERSEEERMEDYLKFVRSGKCGYEDGGKKPGKVEKTVEKAKSDTRSDKYFNAFKKRVALEPEQVKEKL